MSQSHRRCLPKRRGNAFVKSGDYKRGIEAYTSALLSLPAQDVTEQLRVQLLSNRALCFLKNEAVAELEEDCTAALEFDQACVKAWFRRGQARSNMGGTAALRSARSDFQALLKIDPKNRGRGKGTS